MHCSSGEGWKILSAYGPSQFLESPHRMPEKLRAPTEQARVNICQDNFLPPQLADAVNPDGPELPFGIGFYSRGTWASKHLNMTSKPNSDKNFIPRQKEFF